MTRSRPSALTAGLLLLTVVWTGACLGGRQRGAPRNAREGGGGEAITSLSEIYGGDGCGAPKKTGHMTWKVNGGGGGPWNVDLYIPTGQGPRRAVVLLHGAGQTGPGIVNNTNYDQVAADNRAILVAPSSVAPDTMMGNAPPQWNNGRNADVPYARNDVNFLDAIAEALKADACVKKVLGTGFSDGGSMTMAWDCASEKFPDAVVVGSSQLLMPENSCVKRRPIPYRLYMGTKDPRYRGGEVHGAQARPASETVDIFAKFNDCGTEERSREMAPKTTCQQHQGCKQPAELCVVEGMGHAWANPPKADVDAAVDGYAFFEANVPM